MQEEEGYMNKYNNPCGEGERDWWLALKWVFAIKSRLYHVMKMFQTN